MNSYVELIDTLIDFYSQPDNGYGYDGTSSRYFVSRQNMCPVGILIGADSAQLLELKLNQEKYLDWARNIKSVVLNLEQYLEDVEMRLLYLTIRLSCPEDIVFYRPDSTDNYVSFLSMLQLMHDSHVYQGYPLDVFLQSLQLRRQCYSRSI